MGLIDRQDGAIFHGRGVINIYKTNYHVSKLKVKQSRRGLRADRMSQV